ncbi:hypothetical protein [Prauserella muralis]|uniref:Uncharacterized protein n=1 Tax=Prauserella muralis TaxID=588067 RepID=A0A2V4AM88_9PSEU|nr:hypothetical protein [Prauserella muralis]PXY21104.1 hypothetical protein BAY60_26930 [Prauserella muralis]TWE30188.1 hypothetical protein FHX69_2885 [Prauserella muralis]
MSFANGEVEITIAFNEHSLVTYGDSYLAMLWHVAQANPADGFEENRPGEIAERIGREIIRRWLSKAPVELYHHQGQHYYHRELTKHGKWTGPGGTYVLGANDGDEARAAVATRDAAGGGR